jgi:hypothetical protein
MESEKPKRNLVYDYERVKERLIAYLAMRMTPAGQTSLVWANDLEAEVETQLEKIHKRIKRRGGMPDNWKVDCSLDEIHSDGLLKRVNEQLHFMHQFVQEYFTGLYFQHPFPDAAAADKRSPCSRRIHAKTLVGVGADVRVSRSAEPPVRVGVANDDWTAR